MAHGKSGGWERGSRHGDPVFTKIVGNFHLEVGAQVSRRAKWYWMLGTVTPRRSIIGGDASSESGAKRHAEAALHERDTGLSGIGGHVAGMFGAMMEPAKVDRVVAEMAALTANNAHTEARLEWAKAVNSAKWMRILRALQEMTAAYGYLPGGGGEIQVEADRALYRMTEQQFGKGIADQFKAAL